MSQEAGFKGAVRLVDQVSKTRKLRNRAAVTRVMSFTSGKGGVGKTNSVVNVAIALARRGNKVLILDADLGLANIDVLLGLQPKHTIHDVLKGERHLEEIMLDGPEGISIIPAASGIESICDLSTAHKLILMEAVESVAYDFDYLLIDTQAGIGGDVMYFNSASGEIVVVVTGEPTSLTDAYALIKVMANAYSERSFSILANNVPNEREGNRAFTRLAEAVERFLHIRLRYLGHVPTDPMVTHSVRSQRALLELHPTSTAGLAVSAVAKAIDSSWPALQPKGGMQFFFKQLLEASAHGG